MRLGVTTVSVLASIPSIFATNGAAGPTRVWYVNQQAAGANDGTSWQDAFLDLQDALAVAEGADEVWVAAGVYKPDRGTGERMARFHLVDGVAIYGGFAGSESDCEQRDWDVNRTILSGDLNGDDGPRDCALYTDCCREHVNAGCDDPSCAARVCKWAPECCDFDPNQYWNEGCVRLAINECCEIGSRATCENSFVVVEAINTGPETVLDGVVVSGAFITVADANLSENGGVVAVSASISIANCVFENNQISGLRALDAGPLEVRNSAFRDHFGAGILGTGGFMLDSCLFTGNSTAGVDASGTATVMGSDFRNNNLGFSFGGTLTMTGCEFSGNTRGGAVVDDYPRGTVLITRCNFLQNAHGLYLGASGTVRDCKFIGNGPGVMGITLAAVTVTNTLFANNHPGFATIDHSIGRLKLQNCTIAGERIGAGYPPNSVIWLHEASAEISNTVFWDNVTSYGQSGEFMHFYLDHRSSLEINHSIVPGWTGSLGGVGNSGNDPMFVDADGTDYIGWTEDEDLRLLPGSPAINAGNPNTTGLPPTDLDGHARVLCNRVDIGAYEFGMGDYNCDQTVDLSDFANWSTCMTGPGATSIPAGCEAFDFNADSDVDLLDFAEWQRFFLVP